MKKLRTRAVNLAIYRNGLKNVMPKDFPTVEEIEKAGKFLDLLEQAVPEFIVLTKKGEQMNKDIQTGKIPMAKAQETKMKFAQESAILEGLKGDEMLEIDFEDSDFNTFFQQFERWGKGWFYKIDLYLEFRKDLNAANKQPKERTKEK